MLGVGWTKGTLDKWWYVGNTPAIPRLNIPSLNMQDSAGGFRTYWPELVGTGVRLSFFSRGMSFIPAALSKCLTLTTL